MKLNIIQRAYNIFMRVSSEREVSSVMSEITQNYQVLQVSHDYQAKLAFFIYNIEPLWKCPSVMLVQYLHF